MSKLSFKQFNTICEDAQGDLEAIRLKVAQLDKRLADVTRPILQQKQNLERQIVGLQQRANQEQAQQSKQQEQQNAQNQQQQPQQQQPSLGTPGSASGNGQPGG